MKDTVSKIMRTAPNNHATIYVYSVVFRTTDGRWHTQRARNRNSAFEMAKEAVRFPTVCADTVKIRAKRIE